MSVCSVPFSLDVSAPCRSAATTYMQNTGTAGPLIVMDVVVAGQVDAVEEHVHVGSRVDGHPAVPDLADRARVVGVAAHQRRHVERDGQPAAALGQDHLVALVGLPGVAEAGELPDRPRLAAVAAGVDAAGERVLARPADALHAVVGTGRPVHRIDLEPGQRRVVALGLAGGVVALLPAGAARLDVVGVAHGSKLLGRPSSCHRRPLFGVCGQTCAGSRRRRPAGAATP